MLFTTSKFLIFFLLVTTTYFSIPHRFRWMLLLASSYYFYMCWKPEYILLIIISTLIDYFCALRMDQHKEKSRKKKYLMMSLLSNLGILFAFKYFNFFSDSARAVLDSFNILYNVPHFDLLLPVGISFYTFQTLSYSIDVYKGEKKAEKHLGIFALYVSFFPQLVAGPIERSTKLLPQFFEKHNVDYNRISSGLKLMLYGFFKKLVIADYLTVYVDEVFNNPSEYSGLSILFAFYFFGFQIYCDFSGYTDIAIGAARIMGFDLMLNFRRPYLARGIADFWNRWHISLSTWFRDYLYIPLGGNRVSKFRWYLNLFAVFMISGLWHGANWTFVLWGLFHSLYYIGAFLTDGLRQTFYKVSKLNNFPLALKLIKIFITFNLVNFAWIFFRANSVSDAFLLIKNLFLDFGHSPKIETFSLALGIVSIIILIFIELLLEKIISPAYINSRPIWMKWSLYSTAIIVALLYFNYNPAQFIYFQF